jgi:hypothetical protein
MIGRFLRASSPPAIARAISIAHRASSPEKIDIAWMCFALFASWASSWWSGWSPTGTSVTATHGHRYAISGRASAMRVASWRSRLVGGRLAPVSRSTISAAVPSIER